MKTDLTKSRNLLIACGLALVAVAIAIMAGVIPRVLLADAPEISPERAVPAFWVSAGLHVLAAVVLVLIAALSKGRSVASTSGLIITGVAILLFAFALGDAAAAFREAGGPMAAVSTRLIVAVAIDVIVGALTIVVSRLRPLKG